MCGKKTNKQTKQPLPSPKYVRRRKELADLRPCAVPKELETSGDSAQNLRRREWPCWLEVWCCVARLSCHVTLTLPRPPAGNETQTEKPTTKPIVGDIPMSCAKEEVEKWFHERMKLAARWKSTEGKTKTKTESLHGGRQADVSFISKPRNPLYKNRQQPGSTQPPYTTRSRECRLAASDYNRVITPLPLTSQWSAGSVLQTDVKLAVRNANWHPPPLNLQPSPHVHRQTNQHYIRSQRKGQ